MSEASVIHSVESFEHVVFCVYDFHDVRFYLCYYQISKNYKKQQQQITQKKENKYKYIRKMKHATFIASFQL